MSGNFNFVLNEDESSGGKKGSSSSTNYLKELMFDFEVVDLGYNGNKFT